MSGLGALRGGPALPILIGASVMLSLAMGLRQSLGLFMAPAVKDLAITVADFTLAIAVQNLAWGFLQPVAGALADRIGFRPVLVGGVVAYLGGLAVLATADGLLGVTLGAGVLIGLALACCASSMAMAVVSRPVPAAVRSTVLRSAAGTGREATAMARPEAVQASAVPISTPAPSITASAPDAVASTTSPAR